MLHHPYLTLTSKIPNHKFLLLNNYHFRILSTKENINDTHFGKGEKVSSLDLLLEQSDRKITRNQKRKHDEINHVQKVK